MEVIVGKFLLLGEAPNAATRIHPRLWLLPDGSGIQHSANRLLVYTGWDLETYLATFSRDNLLHHLPRRSGKGRNFPIAAARRRVPGLLERNPLTRGVLVLGKRVARAFKWTSRQGDPVPQSRLPYLTWMQISSPSRFCLPAAVVPHPSGINRWWNVPEHRRAARQFFRALQAAR